MPGDLGHDGSYAAQVDFLDEATDEVVVPEPNERGVGKLPAPQLPVEIEGPQVTDNTDELS